MPFENFRRVRAAALASAIVLGILVSQSLPALRTATMRLPDELASASARLPFEGFGGKNRGQFRLGDYSGEFTRIESRLAIFDPGYVSNRGTGSFSLSGPGIDGTINGECSFKENVVTIRIVTFDTRKFGFVCDMHDASRGPVGRLTLVEPRPSGMRARLVARSERVGEADVHSVAFDIRSGHEYEGSRLKAQVPVGYVLSIDSTPVAALELTDVNPTLILADSLPDAWRTPTLVAALSLTVLRDPAASTLGD